MKNQDPDSNERRKGKILGRSAIERSWLMEHEPGKDKYEQVDDVQDKHSVGKAGEGAIGERAVLAKEDELEHEDLAAKRHVKGKAGAVERDEGAAVAAGEAGEEKMDHQEPDEGEEEEDREVDDKVRRRRIGERVHGRKHRRKDMINEVYFRLKCCSVDSQVCCQEAKERRQEKKTQSNRRMGAASVLVEDP